MVAGWIILIDLLNVVGAALAVLLTCSSIVDHGVHVTICETDVGTGEAVVQVWLEDEL